MYTVGQAVWVSLPVAGAQWPFVGWIERVLEPGLYLVHVELGGLACSYRVHERHVHTRRQDCVWIVESTPAGLQRP
jgi:hypothetical protein